MSLILIKFPPEENCIATYNQQNLAVHELAICLTIQPILQCLYPEDAVPPKIAFETFLLLLLPGN